MSHRTYSTTADGSEHFYGEQRGKVVLFTATQVNSILTSPLAPVRQAGDAVPLSASNADEVWGLQHGKTVVFTAAALAQSLSLAGSIAPGLRGLRGMAVATSVTGDETIYGMQGGKVLEFGAAQTSLIAGGVVLTLGALTLSSTSYTVGTPTSGTIIGATATSVITSSGLPTGFTINSAARTWAYDGTGSAATPTITLTETLAGYANSPRANSIGLTIAAASATVPAAPSVVVTSGDTQNSVAWTDGSNGGAAITAHKVYGSTTSGFTPGGGNLLYSGAAASPYVHTGLTNGTTWYYKVVATNSVGDSAASTQQAGTPSAAATAPAAPTLAVTAGNAQNSITWTDGSNGGSTITARKLYRSTSSGFTPGPGNLIATSPTFPYADTGLTNGTTYYYKGIATNAIGDSPASTQQSGAPAAGTLTLAQRGLPSVFTDGRLPVSVTETTPQSGVFGSTYSQATFDTASGTMYYVSMAGSDANDGLSSGAPKATLQAAVDAAATGGRITITTAGRYAPAVVLNKNLSIYGSVAGIYIGSFLTNADVSSWGTLSTTGQVVTLTTGTVSGFVDLTKNRRTDRQGNAIPQVSQSVTAAGGITTLRGLTTGPIELALYGTTAGTADPQAGVYRATSRIGASDNRDLTNKFDTELLAWRSTAVSPLAATGTSQVFIKGVTFVGAQTTIALTARAVYDTCRWLGSIDQCASITGASVFYNCVARNCATANADIIDYDSTGTGVEIGCFLDQCSATGADNASTVHGGTVLRINGTYLDASRCWSDVQGSIVGGFGCTLAGAPDSARYSLNAGDVEGHYAGITFITTGAYDIRIAASTPTTWSTRGFWYDTSYVGKNIDLTNGTYRSPTDRTTAKATADASLASVDLTNMSTLFQTADTSTPVTAVGQTVTRINLVEDGTDYILLTAGAYTYTDVSGKKCLRSSGTANTNNFAFRINSLLLEEACNITLGIVSADTTGIIMRNPTSPNFYGSYSSGNLNGTGTGTPGQRVNAPTYTVDGVGVTNTATALKTAAFNSLPHVVTIKGADLGWLQWTKTPNFMQIFDGDFYGMDISRVTNDTNLRTHEQAMAAKNGATVP